MSTENPDPKDLFQIETDTDQKECCGETSSQHTSVGRRAGREILHFLFLLAIAAVIAFFITHFLIVNAQVPTGSMKNTIQEGDRLVGSRISYLFSDPKRGDVVIFKYPDDESQNYVKRIIGLPGDEIRIADGHVYVNGTQLEEDYLREPMVTSGEEQIYQVPEGCYFMMGDNRNYSLDSRYWNHTYVARNKIIAKVVFRYYSGETSFLDFKLIK